MVTGELRPGVSIPVLLSQAGFQSSVASIVLAANLLD